MNGKLANRNTADAGKITSVCINRVLTLAAAVGAAALAVAPVAAADPGSPSYGQGKQAIDEQVQHYHVQLNADTDWNQYCQRVLQSDLKSGKIAQVDSPTDFIAGCQDEGRALTAPH